MTDSPQYDLLLKGGWVIDPKNNLDSVMDVAIAGDDLHLVIFEGTKTHRNIDLHITSTRFDEPRCLAIVERSTAVLALHGERGLDTTAYIGGADKDLGNAIRRTLARLGLDVATHENANLQGRSPQNICNRGERGKGVQLELARGLRAMFFDSLTTAGRKTVTPAFNRFVNAVRQGLRHGGAL